MALTLVSTTAAERLRRHIDSLSESEAQDALRLLVHRREQAMAARRAHNHAGSPTTSGERQAAAIAQRR